MRALVTRYQLHPKMDRLFIRLIHRVAIFLIGLAAGLSIAGCDGSGSSSDRREPETPPAMPSDLLLYKQDSSSQLFKLDSLGRPTQLSDGAPTSDYAISPDGRYIGFAAGRPDGQTALAIRGLADNTPELPGPLYVDDASLSIQWRPDSQAVVYTVFDAAAFVSHLYLAILGETDPVGLIGSNLGAGARLQVQQSSDGSRLAVLAEYYSSASEFVPDSAALYLLEPEAAGTVSLVGTAQGDANSFSFSWSPYAGELVYQRRLRTGPLAPSVPDNYPAGPLMLMAADGASRILRQAEGSPDWTELAWLASNRILLVATDLEIIDTAGSLVTSHALAGNRRIAVSPDHSRLAFIDRDITDGHPAVYMLELESGEYRDLGPASSDFLIGGAFEDSSLRWSPVGSHLAWNVKPSPFGPDWHELAGELYLYDVASGSAQRVSAELALHDQHYFSDGFFGWLPDGTALDYVARRATGYELAVLDISSFGIRVVGQLATVACTVQRAWRDRDQVLWNACGDGVQHARSKQNGNFASFPVADWDVWRMVATLNRDFAVMQPADGSGGDWQAPWQAYDFSRESLRELDSTGGTSCCGTLLQ